MDYETPRQLIKYCSAEGALAILESSTLRWSSPDLFGDPFELDKHSQLKFDEDGLLEATVKLAVSLIFGREAPVGDNPLINAIRRWRDDRRFNDAGEAHHVLKELLGKMVQHNLTHLDDLMGAWYSFASNLRLCCFSSQPNINLAWEKYGDNHRGVAIAINQGEFTGTDVVRPVEYQRERAEITTLKEQLSTLVYGRPDKSTERFIEHSFEKSHLQKLEHEWRCYKFADKYGDEVRVERSGPGFDDIRIPEEEVSAIYMGLNIDNETRDKIFNYVGDRYAHVSLYKATLAKSGYTIAFESPHSPIS